MVRIKTFDELIEYAVKNCIDNKPIERIEIEDEINVKIVICGESWSEYVDYRCANYIINLQSEINKLIKEYISEGKKEYNLIKKNAIIKVKVDKGSSIINIDILESVKFIFGIMTNTQIFALCAISIASAVGYMSLVKFLQYREKILTKVEDEKTKKELISLFGSLNKRFDELEKPVRSLIQGMEENDKITLPGSSEPIEYYEAKRLYPRKPRTRQFDGYIDDEFLITDIKLETPVHVTLEKGGISFKALVDLPEGMVEEFYNTLEEKHKNKEMPFSIGLQIKASFTERRINSATIQGIGASREGSRDITEIVKVQ